MNPNRQTIDNPSGDAHIDRLRGVPAEGDISGLQARNEARAKAAIRALGARYTCHKANSPTSRLKAPPPTPLFLMRARAA